MTFPTYHAIEGKIIDLDDDPGGVVTWQFRPEEVGVAFRCPCGGRLVAITPQNHAIEFDDEGLLTLEPSCGAHPEPELGRPENWCHFWIKGGQVEMAGDSKCPGGSGEIQLHVRE